MGPKDTTQEEVNTNPWETIEVDDETLSEIRSTVISNFSDKTEDELGDEINTELANYKKSVYDQQKTDIERIDAVKVREGNPEMSDEEAWQIVLSEEETAATAAAADPFASPFDNTEDAATKAKGADSPDLREQQLTELVAITSDPLIAEIIQIKKSGGSVEQFLSSVGQVKDFSTMKPKDLLKEGVLLYKEKGYLSEEEMEDEIERIDGLGITEAIAMAKNVLPDLEAEQRAKFSKYSSASTQSSAAAEEKRRKAESDLLNLSLRVTEKPYFGVNVTKGEITKIVEEIKSGKMLYSEEGDLKVDVLLEAALWRRYRADILKAQAEKAKTKGVLQERKKRMMPSRSSLSVTTRIPAETSADAAYKRERERLKKKNQF